MGSIVIPSFLVLKDFIVKKLVANPHPRYIFQLKKKPKHSNITHEVKLQAISCTYQRVSNDKNVKKNNVTKEVVHEIQE